MEIDRAHRIDGEVLLVGTGGTLAARPRSALDWIDYAENAQYRPIGDIALKVSSLLPAIKMRPLEILRRDSSAIGPPEWLLLGERIEEALRDRRVCGAVVVHGTSTLEEAAFFLHLTCTTTKPIVFTSAQRPLSTVGSDGLANLVAAIRVAQARCCAGAGVLTVFNNEILAARDVVKEGAYELDAFGSRGAGPLGRVGVDGSVMLLRRPTKRGCPDTIFRRSRLGDLPRVDVVLSYAGCDGYAIEASLSAGAQAIVHAGLSPGLPTNTELDALCRARNQGVVVVQASRGNLGTVHLSKQMTRLGFVPALDHSPQKARLIVMLCLSLGLGQRDISEALSAY